MAVDERAMGSVLNETEWREWLSCEQWYQWAYPVFSEIEEAERRLGPASDRPSKEAVYAFIQRELAAGGVALGDNGKHWDDDRSQIKVAVIHHSANPPGLSLERLNAMHLLRLYARYYCWPKPQDRGDVRGQPIYSGHFRNGEQVFFGYHWFVRKGGKTERLLEDHQIGWHAGRWEVNRRSVGICIDADLEFASPADAILEAVAEIIGRYPGVGPTQVVGHREVRAGTSCPGNQFLEGWKSRLVRLFE